MEDSKPKPKPKSTRPNAANRKFTEEEEDELEDRILDSNCNCYEDMIVLAEELLEELGLHCETISKHWIYAFVKRRPDCKEVITERSGGFYIVGAGSTFTRNVYTYSDHPHMGCYKEAKRIWQEIQDGKNLSVSDQTNASGEYWPNLARIHVEIYKRMKEFEDQVVSYLKNPVLRDGKEIFVPVMPEDLDEAMGIIRRVREDLIKEHADQETKDSTEKKAPEVQQKAKVSGHQPAKKSKSAKTANPSPKSQKEFITWTCQSTHTETESDIQSNAPNRKFTKEQEEELVCRIMDSDCRSYTCMQLLAEDLLKEIEGAQHETITDNWTYTFVKRYPGCREKIKEKGGIHLYFDDIHTKAEGEEHRKRKVPTHHAHPHWGRLQEAKKAWNLIHMVQDTPDDLLRHCISPTNWTICEFFIEIGKGVQDGRYEKTWNLSLLPDPVSRLGIEYMIPILPCSPEEMATRLKNAMDDIEKKRHAKQEAKALIPKDGEVEAAKMSQAFNAKEPKKRSTEHTKSPMRATDPNKKFVPTKGKATKKRARQEDKENETCVADCKAGEKAQAERVVKQEEVAHAPKRRKQAKQKEWDPVKAMKQAKGKAWSPTEAYEQWLAANKATPSPEKTAPPAKQATKVKRSANMVDRTAPRRSTRSTKGKKK